MNREQQEDILKDVDAILRGLDEDRLTCCLNGKADWANRMVELHKELQALRDDLNSKSMLENEDSY